jgi:hypothetical protein
MEAVSPSDGILRVMYLSMLLESYYANSLKPNNNKLPCLNFLVPSSSAPRVLDLGFLL